MVTKPLPSLPMEFPNPCLLLWIYFVPIYKILLLSLSKTLYVLCIYYLALQKMFYEFALQNVCYIFLIASSQPATHFHSLLLPFYLRRLEYCPAGRGLTGSNYHVAIVIESLGTILKLPVSSVRLSLPSLEFSFNYHFLGIKSLKF